MDYQNEYINKNPNMHLEHADIKTDQLLSVLPKHNKYKSILDIACGAGKISLNLNEILNPEYMEAIDISEAMIVKAKELDVNKKISWKVADIFNYPNDKIFDLTICADIIEHVEDDIKFAKILKNISREVIIKVPLEDSYLNKFLRYFHIYDPWHDTEVRYGHIHHYNDLQLDEIFINSGFKVSDENYVPMPKRSKWYWEIIRLIFLPIGLFSNKMMVNIVGGFKVYYLT